MNERKSRAPRLVKPSESGCPLTPHQRRVVSMIADGLVGDEIATRLGVKVSTVETHRDEARLRLDAATSAHAVAVCLRQGWIK